MLTLTAVYSGTQVQRTVLWNPVAGEQQADINFFAASSDPARVEPPAEVRVLWALASPQTVRQHEGPVALLAAAAAGDGSAIVAYRWRSDLAGELGTGDALYVPASKLAPGEHVVTVTAINDRGIESPPEVLTLTVATPAAQLVVAASAPTATVGGAAVTVTVHVLDAQGVPVIDDTLVMATTTGGTLDATVTKTLDGVASFRLLPGPTPGDVVITVAVDTGTPDGVSSSVTIQVVNPEVPPPPPQQFRLLLPLIRRGQ